MPLKSAILLLTGFCITTFATAQQKYKGVMVTKLGQTIQGEITVNLSESNAELIEIKSIEKTKTKGTKQTLTTTAKYNTGFIDHIVIKDATYYFRDIKIGYDEAFLKNVCVILVYGSLECGLFQTGDGTTTNSVAVKFPKASFNELASVDFNFYSNSENIPIQISDCETLVDKMIEKHETVTWSAKASREQRIQCFKNIISAYNKCELKN
jgi:hypothetical protein